MPHISVRQNKPSSRATLKLTKNGNKEEEMNSSPIWTGHVLEIEDITRWWKDMNFMFEWHEQYYYINLLMTAFLTIFRRFPTTFQDFRNFPKLFRRPDERSRTFSENFRRCPKIFEDSRRLSRKTRRCFDDTPTNLRTIKETNLISVKSSISLHVKISYLLMWGYRIVFKQFITTRYTTDFYIINNIHEKITRFWLA